MTIESIEDWAHNITLVLLNFTIWYAVGVFTQWDMNPEHWGPAVRGTIAFIAIMTTPVVFFLSSIFGTLETLDHE